MHFEEKMPIDMLHATEYSIFCIPYLHRPNYLPSCILSALYMIDQICGAINFYCSISLWQGNDRPVCVCVEWAICGSWCWAAVQTIWQSSGVSLSMAHADSVVGWCDTLLGYCYRWMSLMCLTRPLSPSFSICVPLEKFHNGARETNAPRTNTASGLVIGRTHHD